MITLDENLYFSCPDECGQIAVSCSLRMILNNETFFCEACGCEFQASVFPAWLAQAVCIDNAGDTSLADTIRAIYSYLYARGECPSRNILSKILKADRNLWRFFPPEKLCPADMLILIDNPEFISRLDCSLLDCNQIVELLSCRPELRNSNPELLKNCHWEELTSAQWTKLLTSDPTAAIYCDKCNWEKIVESDWRKIINDGKNDFAISIYYVRHGKEITSSVKKYPSIKKYINWESLPIQEWLKLLADSPLFVDKCPWDKMYGYIINLSTEQRQSVKNTFPELWNQRTEVLRYVNFSELQKLSADKYYTILDFFDWEDFFDFDSLSSNERIDLFSKHIQFGERFGWEKLSSSEKVILATRSIEFCKKYGWNNFSKDEILYILKAKPDYLHYFNTKEFDRSFLRKLIIENEYFAKYYKLNFFDYLFFRKFDSKTLCSKITFLWHFIVSVMTFAGFGYFMYDGPCGFKSLWTESHSNAMFAAVFYCAITVLWSYVHAWLFSGRTPFFLTIFSATLGGFVAALQYGYTFFLSKISLANCISISCLLVLILLLIIVKKRDVNGELFRDNKSGFTALGVFYFPVLLLTVILCQPCFHWQFLKINNQITNSARPFRAAGHYYLQKAFISDTVTQKIIKDFESVPETADYDTCKALFAKIPAIYTSLPEIKKLENKLAHLRKAQLIKYTTETIDAYREKDYSRVCSVIYKADSQHAEIQFILGKCNHLGLGEHKVDFKAAAFWYEKAVAQNYAYAMNNLGNLYMDGKGVTKSPQKAYSLYKSSAQMGCVIAQRNLAFAYLNGNGVTKNQSVAYEWFLKAAKQNDAVSQRQVALMSYTSMGTSRNDKDVLDWLTKASEQEDTIAQQMLGAFYLTGTLVKQDYDTAVLLLTKAAKKNNVSAQSLLGLCYAQGRGVKANGESAVFWLTKAAEQNDSVAQYALFEIYYTGKVIDKNPEKALLWLKKAAEKNPSAQYNLGACYWNGDLVERNITLAEFWLHKAHSNGYIKAQETLQQIQAEKEKKKQEEREQAYITAHKKFKDYFKKGLYKEALSWGKKASPTDYEVLCDMGIIYFNGWGIVQDLSQAAKYARQSAAGNYARGYYLLAACYDRQKNMQEAFKYYKKSAELGYIDGQYDVGCCYIFGNGCSVNYSQAYYWFSKAAEQNHAHAEYNLGQMYLNGHGVKRNKNTAKMWFKRAASHGSESAKKILNL